jgi:hypothetical protein
MGTGVIAGSNTNIPMTLLLKISMLLCLSTGTTLSVRAQTAVPPPVSAYQPLPAAQLDQLLGPIALYPDPLIAEILPASTLPTQIVLADRYVNGGGDPNQIDQQAWDASVQAMARYTNVLKWMDDNLTWTTALGQAFINQQPDVMTFVVNQQGKVYQKNLGARTVKIAQAMTLYDPDDTWTPGP